MIVGISKSTTMSGEFVSRGLDLARINYSTSTIYHLKKQFMLASGDRDHSSGKVTGPELVGAGGRPAGLPHRLACQPVARNLLGHGSRVSDPKPCGHGLGLLGRGNADFDGGRGTGGGGGRVGCDGVGRARRVTVFVIALRSIDRNSGHRLRSDAVEVKRLGTGFAKRSGAEGRRRGETALGGRRGRPQGTRTIGPSEN